MKRELHRKHAHKHIKKHLDKGKTLSFIKKELRLLGYEEKHIEQIIRSYLLRHHFVKPLLYSIIPWKLLPLL